MQEIPKDHSISRRTVIASVALVPITALTSAAQATESVLSGSQRQILEAFADRLAPRDAYGPSASECGAIDYIDRSLSDYFAAEKQALLRNLAAVEAFARRTYQVSFTQLPPGDQDKVLIAIENNSAAGFNPDARTFFLRVRQLTLEGMFGDPFYGGNRAFAGWDLIRYPGPRLAVSPEEQKIGIEIKPVHVSAYGGNYGH